MAESLASLTATEAHREITRFQLKSTSLLASIGLRRWKAMCEHSLTSIVRMR